MANLAERGCVEDQPQQWGGSAG